MIFHLKVSRMGFRWWENTERAFHHNVFIFWSEIQSTFGIFIHSNPFGFDSSPRTSPCPLPLLFSVLIFHILHIYRYATFLCCPDSEHCLIVHFHGIYECQTIRPKTPFIFSLSLCFHHSTNSYNTCQWPMAVGRTIIVMHFPLFYAWYTQCCLVIWAMSLHKNPPR